MQQAPAGSQGRRWLRWGRVLLLGVVLGLLQLLLLTQAEALVEWSNSLAPIVATSAFLYLLIPALAGFLAARQSGGTSSGVGPGCLVGGMSLLVLITTTVVVGALMRAHMLAHPACQPDVCVSRGVGFAIWIIMIVLLVEGVGSVLGGLLGGWLGGELGDRWAPSPNQSSEAPEQPAP